MIAEIAAIAIFLVMFALIITEKFERHIVTLACGALTLILVFGLCLRSPGAIMETLNLSALAQPEQWYTAGSHAAESSGGINWSTILFIAGMMVMVEGMAHAGFFRWLCMTIARLVHYRTIPIFISFMVISTLLSMFIDSITVVLFLAAITIELARLLKFDPIPVILSEIFCANLGGSATMCGDPPNIIIGTALGYSFADFIENTGLIAAIALIVVLVFFYLFYKNELQQAPPAADSIARYPSPAEAITDKKSFAASSVIFLLAVALLVTHSVTGLTVAFIGVLIACLTLLAAGKNALNIIKKIDYKTLLFFIGLFIVVGGLEKTGVLVHIAELLETVSGGNVRVMIAIIIWGSAIASAFIDNIPFAATMIPVIQSISQTTGISLPVLAWALSIGTDIGGSATPIGASANVVGMSIAEKEGYPVNWKTYCRANVPATVIVLAISTLVIWSRYC